MFDLEKIKRESSLSDDDLARLTTQIRDDFGEDELMFELHFVRVVKALKEKWITLEDVFAEESEA